MPLGARYNRRKRGESRAHSRADAPYHKRHASPQIGWSPISCGSCVWHVTSMHFTCPCNRILRIAHRCMADRQLCGRQMKTAEEPSCAPCSATEAIAALSFAPNLCASGCLLLKYYPHRILINNDRCAHAQCRNFAWRRSPGTKHAAPLLYRKSASQVAVFIGQRSKDEERQRLRRYNRSD